MRWHCWDCEVILETRTKLCETCVRHRVDGHRAKQRTGQWCHGAGPAGRSESRRQLKPVPITWEQTVTKSGRRDERW